MVSADAGARPSDPIGGIGIEQIYGRRIDGQSHLLAQRRPFVAGSIAVLMFSLIGLPPLAGFFAKWHVFLAAIEAQLFILAVIGVLASAVSAFYYLRIVKLMYFDEPVAEFEAVPRELTIVTAVAVFFVVTYYLTVGSPLASLAHTAAGSLF